MFKVNEQIISRFQIKNTPALITTDQDKFRITLFSEAEVRGIGAPNLSEENNMKLGFIIGALFATWLTLNYPDQMRSYFTKAVDYIESVATFITSK